MKVERRLLSMSGLLCFCAGALYGWSAMISPVQVAFHASTAQTGLIFSFAIVSFTAAIVLSPAIMKHRPPPFRLVVFGVLATLSVTASAFSSSYIVFIILFSGGFGAMSGALYITTLGVAANSTYHAIMTPVMVASFGAGGAVFGPFWRLTDEQGWGLSGLLFLSIGLCIALAPLALIKSSGISCQAPTDDYQQPNLTRIGSRNCLCLTWCIFMFGSFGGLMVLGLAAKMMDASAVPIHIATLSLAGVAIGNTLGRLSIAGLVRINGISFCFSIAIALSIFGLLCAALDEVLPFGLILIASGYGMIASSIPILIRQIYGPQAFPKIFSLMMTAWGTAGFLAPWVGGLIFDISGRFDAALWIAGTMMVLCAITAWHLRKILNEICRQDNPP